MVSRLIPRQASSWAMRCGELNVSRMQLIRVGVILVMKFFAGVDWGGAGIQSPLKGKRDFLLLACCQLGKSAPAKKRKKALYQNLFENEHKINFFQTNKRKQRLIIISIIDYLSMLIISSPLSAKAWKSVFLKYSGAVMMASIRNANFSRSRGL